MKKFKLINTIMVASAVATPMSFLASCSEDNYADVAQMIKDDQKVIFTDLSRRHRATFDEAEGFQYIDSLLSNKSKYGTEKVGEDKWSSLSCVQKQAEKDIAYLSKGRISDKQFGNVWYDLPASKGWENKPKILLHSHVDMTMDWKDDAALDRWHNSIEDQEQPGGVNVDDSKYVEEGYLFSDGTTSLGADNGMGVALMISLALHRNDFKHPGIRLLFTADESGAVPYFYSEEEGEHTPGEKVKDPKTVELKMLASGADLLTFDQRPKDFQEVIYDEAKGEYVWGEKIKTMVDGYETKPFGDNFEFGNIISFDGSTKNTIYNSAAGIHECQMKNILTNHTEPDPVTHTNREVKMIDECDRSLFVDVEGKEHELEEYELTISGLYGGHSGYDINKGHGNALQMLMQTLSTDDKEFRLVEVSSGDSAYQICKEAKAKFIVSREFGSVDNLLQTKVDIYKEIFKSSYPRENNLDFKLERINYGDEAQKVQALNPERSSQITIFSILLPYGPNTWFDEKHEEVKSSCNFGPLKITQNITNDSADFQYNLVARSANAGELVVFQSLFHAAARQVLYDIVDPDDRNHVTHIEDLVWEPSGETNNLSKLAGKGYKNINIKNSTFSSHAWLEIACFPQLFTQAEKTAPDMICYGPEIEFAHSIEERVDTNSEDGVIKALLYVFNHCDQLKSY